jgi:hypothetical protein
MPFSRSMKLRVCRACRQSIDLRLLCSVNPLCGDFCDLSPLWLFVLLLPMEIRVLAEMVNVDHVFYSDLQGTVPSPGNTTGNEDRFFS